jgi:hypothetical protein
MPGYLQLLPALLPFWKALAFKSVPIAGYIDIILEFRKLPDIII